ncbi:hypothetical protein TRFO_37050 [Tritrichomonas foetus]|uniref:Uncharacterized protein n=1 Tax=Tritrichomonas foetus TaxID=1144522 RepID=A0A1J4JC08_9EUKA|nr:hypothetical protein TRFO_37050 [Tritrichomonas foetus]|eukprot:OHS96738.1 hypothetical protein TRFO_37050 [Tritrichomonas foetus]
MEKEIDRPVFCDVSSQYLQDYSLFYQNIPGSTVTPTQRSLAYFFQGQIQSLVFPDVTDEDIIRSALIAGIPPTWAKNALNNVEASNFLISIPHFSSQDFSTNIENIPLSDDPVYVQPKYDSFYALNSSYFESNPPLPFTIDLTISDLEDLIETFTQIISSENLSEVRNIFSFYKNLFERICNAQAYFSMYGRNFAPENYQSDFSTFFSILSKFDILQVAPQKCDINIVPIIFLIAFFGTYLSIKVGTWRKFSSFENFLEFIFIQSTFDSLAAQKKMLPFFNFKDADYYFYDFANNVSFFMNPKIFTEKQINFFKFLAEVYHINHFKLDLSLTTIKDGNGKIHLILQVFQTSKVPSKYQDHKVLIFRFQDQYSIRHFHCKFSELYFNSITTDLLTRIIYTTYCGEFANFLLDGRNLLMDFNHIFSDIPNHSITLSRNDIYHERLPHILVLHYYPIFYNAIVRYCQKSAYLPYPSIKGTPGTGKSYMLYYLILRWALEQDITNYKGDLINTIIIRRCINESTLALIFRVDHDQLTYGIIDNFQCLPQCCIIKQGFIVKYSLSSIATTTIESHSIPNIDEQTLIIYDDFPNIISAPSCKCVILNSIGSPHPEKKGADIEHTVFTPLPTQNEMNLISSFLSKNAASSFQSKNSVAGKSLRFCTLEYMSKDKLVSSIEETISLIDFSKLRSAVSKPESFMSEQFDNIRNFSSLIVQATSYEPKHSELGFLSNCTFDIFFDRFHSNRTVFSSQTVFEMINQKFIENKQLQRNLEHQYLFDVPYMQSLRSFFCEKNFHSDMYFGNMVKFTIIQTYFYMRGKNKFQENIMPPSEFIVNQSKTEVTKVSEFEQLFNIETFRLFDKHTFYFLPRKTNYPCIDSAFFEKNGKILTLILFQITVSDDHEFNMLKFFKLLEVYFDFKKVHSNDYQIDICFWIATNKNDFSFDNITGYMSKNPEKALERQEFIETQFLAKIHPLPRLSDITKTSIIYANKQTLSSQKQTDLHMKEIFCEITQKIPFYIAKQK